MLQTCSALRKDGQPCRFAARRETALCVNHDPSFRAQQVANRRRAVAHATANRRHRAEARASIALFELDEWALADRASIQGILDAVLRLELAGRIPNTRARNLLRALSLAIRNFDTPGKEQDGGRTCRHDITRYHYSRQRLDERLEAICAEADRRDAARKDQ